MQKLKNVKMIYHSLWILVCHKFEVLLKDHNLKIDVDKDNDIPLLCFNYESIARALTNYLSNAIKYAPLDSTIKVKLFKESEKKSGYSYCSG